MGWLTDLLTAFARIIPRLTVVTTVEAGVKFVRGWDVVPIGPGLVWHWPLTTELVVIGVSRQPLEIPEKPLTTLDGVTVIVGGVAIFKIENVALYLTKNTDTDQAIVESGSAAIRDVVTTKTFEEIQVDDRKTVRNALTRAVQEAVEPFGLVVERCRLTSFARTRAVTLLHQGEPLG